MVPWEFLRSFLRSNAIDQALNVSNRVFPFFLRDRLLYIYFAIQQHWMPYKIITAYYEAKYFSFFFESGVHASQIFGTNYRGMRVVVSGVRCEELRSAVYHRASLTKDKYVCCKPKRSRVCFGRLIVSRSPAYFNLGYTCSSGTHAKDSAWFFFECAAQPMYPCRDNETWHPPTAELFDDDP